MNGQKKSVTEDKIVPTDPSRRQAASSSSSFLPPRNAQIAVPRKRERGNNSNAVPKIWSRNHAPEPTEKEEEETIDRPRKIGR